MKRLSTNSKDADHGFTLIEVIVVLVTLGILATVVINKDYVSREVPDKGKAEALKAHLRYAQGHAITYMEILRFEFLDFYDGAYHEYALTDITGFEPVYLPGDIPDDLPMTSTQNPVYFNMYGQPVAIDGTPLAGDITVTAGQYIISTITITQETGFIE